MHLLLPGALTVGAVLALALMTAAATPLAQDSWSAAAAFVYAACSQICHQKSERSFALAGMPLPVCARCYGLYFSGAIGALAAWAAQPGQLHQSRLVLGLAAVPTAATWGLEAAGLAAFSNTIRAGAALPLGAAAGWVFVQMLRYDAESHGREIHDSRTPARFG